MESEFTKIIRVEEDFPKRSGTKSGLAGKMLCCFGWKSRNPDFERKLQEKKKV